MYRHNKRVKSDTIVWVLIGFIIGLAFGCIVVTIAINNQLGV